MMARELSKFKMPGVLLIDENATPKPHNSTIVTPRRVNALSGVANSTPHRPPYNKKPQQAQTYLSNLKLLDPRHVSVVSARKKKDV